MQNWIQIQKNYIIMQKNLKIEKELQKLYGASSIGVIKW